MATTSPGLVGPLGHNHYADMEPLTKEQLEMGKVFVGGLSRDTTTTGLRVYFERFGHISDCVVMKDRSTGAPRGFGFVTYRNQQIADHVVAQRHLIDGKEVEAKPAVPRDSESLLRAGLPGAVGPSPPLTAPPVTSTASNLMLNGELKIFVGGLSHETSEVEFVTYFETYGKVTDCVIMCDPHTRKPRGFGFITYDNTASVDRVCNNKFHDLNGKRVEVKRAIPQDRMLATADEPGPPEAGGRRFPLAGRSPGAAGAPFGGGQMWGGGASGSFESPPPPVRAVPPPPPDDNTTGLDAALSAAAAVLGGGGSEAAFNYPGGNFSSATRSLNQGIRTTYGSGADQDGSPEEEEAPPFAREPQYPQDAQGQQQQLLHQLQEEQLKLQIAQQAFNVQQVKQLQEMQQLVAAQHAIVAQQSRSGTFAGNSLPTAAPAGSFGGSEAIEAQLAQLSCSSNGSPSPF